VRQDPGGQPVFANTSRLGGGQEELISGTFKLLARRGTCVIESTDFLSIPFAKVTGALNASLVVERLGGSDGRVECVAWIDGGSIPWDGAWIEPIPPLEDGQITGQLTIRVDPQTFKPGGPPTSLQAGWEEDTDPEGAVCYFGHFISGSRGFARIRCLWLDQVP
jgi:hypothetical protein